MLILEIIRLVREPLCDLRRGQFVILKAASTDSSHVKFAYAGIFRMYTTAASITAF